MLDLEDFHLAVRNYGLVPQRFLHTVALAVPLLEIGCASLLLVGFGTGPVAALLVLLLGVFSVAISINLLRGRTFSCGCSGKVASDITWRHVVSNALLAVMAAAVSLWAVQPLSIVAGWGLQGSPRLSSSEAMALLLAAAAVAVSALLVSEALIVRNLILRTVGRTSTRWTQAGKALR